MMECSYNGKTQSHHIKQYLHLKCTILYSIKTMKTGSLYTDLWQVTILERIQTKWKEQFPISGGWCYGNVDIVLYCCVFDWILLLQQQSTLMQCWTNKVAYMTHCTIFTKLCCLQKRPWRKPKNIVKMYTILVIY